MSERPANVRPGRVLCILLMIACSLASASGKEDSFVRIEKAVYTPFFGEEGEEPSTIGPLEVDKYPITNAEFLSFLKLHPQWSRARIKSLFADSSYLSHWDRDDSYSPDLAKQPVTHVSWFAARAYCRSHGKRLMTVAEWEAVADSMNPGNLELILKWYSQTSANDARALKSVQDSTPNRFGLYGMHGLIWEWVEDYASVILAADSRDANDAKGAMFCGSGSLKAKDPSQYATFMRYAHRSSLSAKYTSGTLGFRCAKNP